MAHQGIETEIKLSVADPAAGCAMLAEAGFSVSKLRVFESNTLYDTPEKRLRDGGAALRIRRSGSDAILTYKGRPEPAKYKIREEIEVEVSDAGSMSEIVRRLGFVPVFRYDKYRTEYRQALGGTACLDETPIGAFIELEGDPEWIDSAARLLGFAPEAGITVSYSRLYRRWCEARGIESSEMVFPEPGPHAA